MKRPKKDAKIMFGELQPGDLFLDQDEALIIVAIKEAKSSLSEEKVKVLFYFVTNSRVIFFWGSPSPKNSVFSYSLPVRVNE